MDFECSFDTDKGSFLLKTTLDEKQAKYLIELGYRYLITCGALALPEKVHVPTKEEQEELNEIAGAVKRVLN